MRNFIVCIVYAERAVRKSDILVVGSRRECSLYDWERLPLHHSHIGRRLESCTALLASPPHDSHQP